MELNETEVIERFKEGLLRSAARARELAVVQKSKSWLDVAVMLDQLRENGVEIYNAKPLTRQQVLDALDRREKTMVIN